MIITRTPYRISFFGGGTDYPAYYKEYGGAVLAASINRYCYINIRPLPPFFKHRHRISYSIIEEVEDIDQIRHPSVRECLRYVNAGDGLEIHHDGDLPARSGLGSSSSFTVGLLNGLLALRGKMISNTELAEAAIHVEQNMIKENVGSQDQIMAAFGGLNIISLGNGVPADHFQVKPLCIETSKGNELGNHLMLFFTGIFRNASEIAGEQIRRINKIKKELDEMHGLVDQAVKILSDSNRIEDFGRLLHENWLIKRSLSPMISTSQIDEIYKTARNAGAIGGKLLGAGAGGFMLFFVKPENHAQVKESLNLLNVPFSFDYTGSKILYYAPESTGVSVSH